jgi:hypothetical protein
MLPSRRVPPLRLVLMVMATRRIGTTFGRDCYETKQYDPFGVVTATTGTGPQLLTTGFQGDWTDPETGDVNMGARWYNPSAFKEMGELIAWIKGA